MLASGDVAPTAATLRAQDADAVLDHIGTGTQLIVPLANGEPTAVLDAIEAAVDTLQGVGVHQMHAIHDRPYMARYVGAAVFTAVAAAVYGGTTTSKIADGHAPADALASGFARVAIVMAVLSALGIPLAMAAKRMHSPKPKMVDYAAAAAAHTHTLPRPDPIPFMWAW